MNNNETNEDIRVCESNRSVRSDCETYGEERSDTPDKASIRTQILQRAESIRASKPELDYERRYGYVYLTENLVNGKLYIGQHKALDVNGKYLGSGDRLHKAIVKYGRKNFKVYLLEWCESLNVLNEKEIEWIKVFNADQNRDVFYNIASGGLGNPGAHVSNERIEKIRNSLRKYYEVHDVYNKGKKSIISEEARRRMRDSAKKRVERGGHPFTKPHSKEHTEKLRLMRAEYNKTHDVWNRGLKVSEESKIKQSLLMKEYYKTHTTWNKGIKRTELERQHMREGLRGYYDTHVAWNLGYSVSKEIRDAHSKRMKGKRRTEESKKKQGDTLRGKSRVHQYSVINVETGEVFSSIRKASKSIDETPYVITNALDKDKLVGGYHWKRL